MYNSLNVYSMYDSVTSTCRYNSLVSLNVYIQLRHRDSVRTTLSSLSMCTYDSVTLMCCDSLVSLNVYV